LYHGAPQLLEVASIAPLASGDPLRLLTAPPNYHYPSGSTRIPYSLSPDWLRIHRTCDELRTKPPFHQLVKDTA
jgi:hypothetical protein